MTGADVGKQPDTTSPTGTSASSVASTSEGIRARHGVRRSRVGTLRTALIASAMVLALLLVFVLQNGQRVKVSFLGFSGHMPLGVAILFAGIAGALLLAIPGTARIVQLRRVADRQHREDQSL
jgi:putative membrane protein